MSTTIVRTQDELDAALADDAVYLASPGTGRTGSTTRGPTLRDTASGGS